MAISQPNRSDGLVIRVGIVPGGAGDSLQKAKRIVAESLPGQWEVAPIARESRDFTIRRAGRKANPTVSQAFNFAYLLRRHRDVEDCEPALMQSLEGPPEIRPRLAALPASTSAGSGIDLPCAASHSWIHSFCSIETAWNLSPLAGGKSQGEGIIVGHPDTGYTNHPEIDDPVRLLKTQGFNFEDDNADPRDDLSGAFGGHGTATSSVIMSSLETPEMISGVAPKCSVVPLRVTTSVVLFSFSKLAESIQFAADHNHHVLSISLGGPIYSRFLERAVQYAVDRGIIVVCAAGNVWPFVVYPARFDEVIAVAACNCSSSIWSSSASGSTVDITAPGESVWRALAAPAGFSIGTSSGTSFSTAIVAGTAALWLAHHGRDNLIARYGPSGMVSVFKELLVSQGFDRPSGWDTSNFGAGILNASKLLTASLPDTPSAHAMSAIRSSPGPRTVNQVDELMELFPHEDPARVRKGLSKFLQVSERELNTSMRDVAEEIYYMAVTDMEFRRQLSGRRKTPVAAGAVAAAGSMSRQLRRMVAAPVASPSSSKKPNKTVPGASQSRKKTKRSTTKKT